MRSAASCQLTTFAEVRYLAASPLAMWMPSSAYHAEYLPFSVTTPLPPWKLLWRNAEISSTLLPLENSVAIFMRAWSALPSMRRMWSISDCGMDMEKAEGV